MADFFFDNRDDFHYDNSGYYGYIVLNGDESNVKDLVESLERENSESGLDWHRYGRSFRVANDGKKYDWYIRLQNIGESVPPTGVVDAFILRYLKGKQPAKTSLSLFETAGPTPQTKEQRRVAFLRKLDDLNLSVSDDLEQLRGYVEDFTEVVQEDRWDDEALHQTIDSLEDINEHLTTELTELEYEFSAITSATAESKQHKTGYEEVIDRLTNIDSALLRLQENNISPFTQRNAYSTKDDRKLSALETRLEELAGEIKDLHSDIQAVTSQNMHLVATNDQYATLIRLFDELSGKLMAGIVELRDEVRQGMTNGESQEDRQSELNVILTEIERLRDGQSHSTPVTDPVDHERVQKLEEQKRDIETRCEALKVRLNSLSETNEQLLDQVKDKTDQIDRLNASMQEIVRKFGELQKENESPVSFATMALPAMSRKGIVGLKDVLPTLLPVLELVDNSWDFLQQEIQNYDPFLRKFGSIVWDDQIVGSKALRGKKGWYRLHVARTWRLYYCRQKTPTKHKVVALIGKKKDENEIMNWLDAHPASSYLVD